MATFTPPANASEVPGLAADTRGPARRLFRLAGGQPRARNFYIVDGALTEVDPTATYNADGSLNQTGTERITRWFQSGTGPFTVTAAEHAIISTAGFRANLTNLAFSTAFSIAFT